MQVCLWHCIVIAHNVSPLGYSYTIIFMLPLTFHANMTAGIEHKSDSGAGTPQKTATKALNIIGAWAGTSGVR